MVNTNAVKAAIFVSVGLLALVFVGTVLRYVSRLASYAVLVFLVVAAGYATYELYTGWARGGESAPVSDGTDPEPEADAEDSPTSDDSPAVLTDEDLDSELEQLRSQSEGRTAEADTDT